MQWPNPKPLRLSLSSIPTTRQQAPTPRSKKSLTSCIFSIRLFNINGPNASSSTEKHLEAFSRASWEELKTLKRFLKKMGSRPIQAPKRCSKILAVFLFLLLITLSVAFVYYSFFIKEWVQIATGFSIFALLTLEDFTMVFKSFLPCCSQNMAEMTKFIVYISLFLLFSLFSVYRQADPEKARIATAVCGTILGFLMAGWFGRELKKFSKKAL